MIDANASQPKTMRHAKVTTKRGTNPHVQTDDLAHAGPDELKAEIARLRLALKAAKRSEAVDTISGLSNRATFLDQANAEFNRSRRYGHDLTLCVTDIVGLGRVIEEHGEAAGDHVITCVAQMCLSSSRFGVDVLGRISENQIAIMLPETALTGGLKFLTRMQKVVTEMPIYVQDARLKPALKVSADALREEDTSFMDLFNRTWRRTSPGQKVRSAA